MYVSIYATINVFSFVCTNKIHMGIDSSLRHMSKSSVYLDQFYNSPT